MAFKSLNAPAPGNTVPAVRKITQLADGSNQVEFQITLEGAAVPERRYAADFVAVSHVDDCVNLIFGQKRLIGAGLRNMLVVRMTPESVMRFLDTCVAFGPQLEDFAKRNSVVIPSEPPLHDEPKDAVSLVANMLATAFSGREAVIDFHHFTALALNRMSASNSSQLALEAVVRVDLTTGLLLALLRQLYSLVPNLPATAV